MPHDITHLTLPAVARLRARPHTWAWRNAAWLGAIRLPGKRAALVPVSRLQELFGPLSPDQISAACRPAKSGTRAQPKVFTARQHARALAARDAAWRQFLNERGFALSPAEGPPDLRSNSTITQIVVIGPSENPTPPPPGGAP